MTCMCDKPSFNHSAGHCPGHGYIAVVRRGRLMHVCCDCTMPGDTRPDYD